MNYLEITFKLVLGLLALITVINLTGKGNLAPTTAMEQIQNYVRVESSVVLYIVRIYMFFNLELY